MAFEISPGGLNGTPRANFDSLGKAYICIAVIWSTVVACGAGFLLQNRHLPVLRVRNTHIWISAVFFLHMYWVICVMAYVMNGTYPCAAEYWIMSIYLPLGIALYQVNGMHLLHIASLQSYFVHPNPFPTSRTSKTKKGRWQRLQNLVLPDTLSTGEWNFIVFGMIVQVTVTLIVYLVSRRFHPSWGVVGHGVSHTQCRRNWEWIPSIFWQFFWTWIYAPYLLWRVRKIHDLHGWRLQTIVCCIAGLPGSPMWLLSLYSPYFSSGLANASQYFVPPLWFTPGIVAIEISIILIPCIKVIRSRKLQQDTLDQLLDWERKQEPGTSFDTGSTYVATGDDVRLPSPESSTAPARDELYSMKALEKALTTNINPLLRFSALKDFSGENISFLKHVQDWKANWTATYSSPKASGPTFVPRPAQPKRTYSLPGLLEPETLRRQQFALAVEIYASFISPQYSDFPINISSPQLRDLESVFESAASTITSPLQENPATPFAEPPMYPFHPDDMEKPPPFGSEKDSISIASTAVTSCPSPTTTPSRVSTTITTTAVSLSTLACDRHLKAFSLLELRPRLSSSIALPQSFTPAVFDDAEKSIRYMVLTNTWPRFVEEGLVAGKTEGRDYHHQGGKGYGRGEGWRTWFAGLRWPAR